MQDAMCIKLQDGAVFKIFQETDPESPRERDNLGVMVCWHPTYTLGDAQVNKRDYSNADEVLAFLKKEHDIVAYLPLYLLDHSGLSICTNSFNDPWDSGQVGWIFCTKEACEKAGVPNEADTEHLLRCEVDIYDQYLRGNVYGFVLLAPPCDSCGAQEAIIDSCWGFYGCDLLENGMLEHVPEEYQSELKEKADVESQITV